MEELNLLKRIGIDNPYIMLSLALLIFIPLLWKQIKNFFKFLSKSYFFFSNLYEITLDNGQQLKEFKSEIKKFMKDLNTRLDTENVDLKKEVLKLKTTIVDFEKRLYKVENSDCFLNPKKYKNEKKK